MAEDNPAMVVRMATDKPFVICPSISCTLAGSAKFNPANNPNSAIKIPITVPKNPSDVRVMGIHAAIRSRILFSV